MMQKAIRVITAIGMLFAVAPAFVTPLHAQTEASSEELSQDSSLRVMSYNLYRGGTMRGQPLSQTAKAILEAKADVVGVQETKSPKGHTLEALAKLLGWNHSVSTRCPILTRFEIAQELDDGIKVKLPSGQHAYVFNLHLPSSPYQPYQLLNIEPRWHKHKGIHPFIKTEAEAITFAKKARGEIIAKLLKQIDSLPDKDAPVFVVGDFNEPSHLDWTEEAAESGRHPIKVEYPTSLAMAKAGFTDAWRAVYPDEMKNPGFTWSPMYKPDDPTTHYDRIDFVYFKGKGVKVNKTKIVGENEENADIVISPYPSDHRAVVAAFTLPNQANSDSSSVKEETTKLRVVAYNVACGQWATPEQIGAELKPLNPDIVLLSEVPKANRGKKVKDWSLRLAETLDLKHVHVGTVSSANHKAPKWGDMTGDYGGKYKSILSRTPLTEGKDILPEGSGWKRASAVRVETEAGGRKFALYSLHLPGLAHRKGKRIPVNAWAGSKHKSLSETINAEDPSFDVIVGGDFNEWTDSVVMGSLLQTCKLKNASTERSIDHILYSTARPIKLLEETRNWGPKNQNDKNEKADGCLSDHPWVYSEFEIPAVPATGSKE